MHLAELRLLLQALMTASCVSGGALAGAAGAWSAAPSTSGFRAARCGASGGLGSCSTPVQRTWRCQQL